MKIIIFLLISLITIACDNINYNQNTQNIMIKNDKESIIEDTFITKTNHIKNKTDSLIKETILDTILQLKEVIERNKYVIKQTNGERNLCAYISATPKDLSDNNYTVKVAEDNGGAYATHFNFLVNKNTYKINYYDVILDTTISLNEWRKNK